MTDPTGQVFLSYKHEQGETADHLESALREHGIPVWRDTSEIRSKPLESQLQEVLADPSIASGIALVSQGVAESDIIRKVELPAFETRWNADDGFFVVVAPCPDLGYSDAKDILAQSSSLSGLGLWYMETIPESTYDAALDVVEMVLKQRLEQIDASLSSGDPIECSLDTHESPAHSTDPAIAIDWSNHFDQGPPSPTVWEQRLLPAVTTVTNHVSQHAPGRPLRFRGKAHLPASFTLGQCLEPTRGIHASWMQQNQPGDVTEWSLTKNKEESGLKADLEERTVSASSLAVMVNITADVESEVINTKPDLPELNAILRLTPDDGPRTNLTPAQAVDAADVFRTAVQDTIKQRSEISTIHLFMAVPTGLAFLLGQKTNTFPPIQTYLHLEDKGKYQQAALLRNHSETRKSEKFTVQQESLRYRIWKNISNIITY
jgi:hypothetical protein